VELLDIQGIRWALAKKVRPLRAKPMVSLLVDKSVMGQFLVDTLEAREPVSPQAMFCIGEANDAWQQMPDKLLKHYEVRHIDEDGWMVCHPKPEGAREFFEVTLAVLQAQGYWDFFCALPTGTGYVQAQWSETVGGRHNVQRFGEGDFIVRSREDASDVWVVRRKIWLNSYAEMSTG